MNSNSTSNGPHTRKMTDQELSRILKDEVDGNPEALREELKHLEPKETKDPQEVDRCERCGAVLRGKELFCLNCQKCFACPD